MKYLIFAQTNTDIFAIGGFLEQWRWNVTQAERVLDARLAEENFQNVVWYLVVMIGMFAFIVVAILVSTVKSKRREHSNDPYHKYIEGDWKSKGKILYCKFKREINIANIYNKIYLVTLL
uniref:Potassium voltage-gated channel subfamily E member 2 n=1 Tax=Astyanax mexicanus TaxID=7994 RepID=W5LUF4_ASTMX